jgi:hypothetical protein
LTCRNSTTRQTWPSSSIVVPVRKSLLEIIPADRIGGLYVWLQTHP